MHITNQSVLITGASGFIGSHLTTELVKRGCRVRALVPYNEANSWGWLDTLGKEIKSSLQVAAVDIRDSYAVFKVVEDCEVVFHLAALISIPYSYQAPASYVETNINGTLNVLQAAREAGVRKIIHTSTSEVYGTALNIPITEDHPLQAQSPYSASKIGADQLALAFYRSFDTPVSIIRPFNTYGPRQSLRAVIPTIITQVASGRKEIQMGVVGVTRDFNYVADLISGFIKIAESDISLGEVINIGTGFDISIEAVVQLIADIMGRSVEIVCDRERLRPLKSEVGRLCASNEKALKLLDWSPSYAGVSGLRKGLEETINWFNDPGNILHYKLGSYHM